jgi:hypothetical protein
VIISIFQSHQSTIKSYIQLFCSGNFKLLKPETHSSIQTSHVDTKVKALVIFGSVSILSAAISKLAHKLLFSKFAHKTATSVFSFVSTNTKFTINGSVSISVPLYANFRFVTNSVLFVTSVFKSSILHSYTIRFHGVTKSKSHPVSHTCLNDEFA